MADKDVTITFDMEEKSKERLKVVAERNYRSLSAQIRLILEDYLEKNK